MTYTAHTNNPIPFLSTVITPPDPARDDSVTHNLEVKEIPIAFEYRDYWKDGQKVDESDFEIIGVQHPLYPESDSRRAIPKEKEETQE